MRLFSPVILLTGLATIYHAATVPHWGETPIYFALGCIFFSVGWAGRWV